MGTSKIRLVAVDMDGTLLNRERKITQYTQNVIRRAVSQGVVLHLQQDERSMHFHKN